jgi:hypothetical protein
MRGSRRRPRHEPHLKRARSTTVTPLSNGLARRYAERMRHFAWLCLLAFLPGCYQSFSDPFGRDGAVSPRDSGVFPTFDGGIAPLDTGVRPRRDAGPPRPFDAGSGVCVDGERVPSYSGPGCREETTRCLEGCEDEPSIGECQNQCLVDDPECVNCYNQTIVSCGNEVGCQAAWDELACCTERECPGIGDGVERLACGTDTCFDTFDRYSECVIDVLGACEMRISRCFAR